MPFSFDQGHMIELLDAEGFYFVPEAYGPVPTVQMPSGNILIYFQSGYALSYPGGSFGGSYYAAVFLVSPSGDVLDRRRWTLWEGTDDWQPEYGGGRLTPIGNGAALLYLRDAERSGQSYLSLGSALYYITDEGNTLQFSDPASLPDHKQAFRSMTLPVSGTRLLHLGPEGGSPFEKLLTFYWLDLNPSTGEFTVTRLGRMADMLGVVGDDSGTPSLRRSIVGGLHRVSDDIYVVAHLMEIEDTTATSFQKYSTMFVSLVNVTTGQLIDQSAMPWYNAFNSGTPENDDPVHHEVVAQWFSDDQWGNFVLPSDGGEVALLSPLFKNEDHATEAWPEDHFTRWALLRFSPTTTSLGLPGNVGLSDYEILPSPGGLQPQMSWRSYAPFFHDGRWHIMPMVGGHGLTLVLGSNLQFVEWTLQHKTLIENFYDPETGSPYAINPHVVYGQVGVSEHFVLNPEPEGGSHWHPGTLPLHILAGGVDPVLRLIHRDDVVPPSGSSEASPRIGTSSTSGQFNRSSRGGSGPNIYF